jgi:hypothetical protein
MSVMMQVLMMHDADAEAPLLLVISEIDHAE